jgi:hypothetical protein
MVAHNLSQPAFSLHAHPMVAHAVKHPSIATAGLHEVPGLAHILGASLHLSCTPVMALFAKQGSHLQAVGSALLVLSTGVGQWSNMRQ